MSFYCGNGATGCGGLLIKPYKRSKKAAKIKTIILDFDGTIVESVGIKDRAFRTLFQYEEEKLDEIMSYHLAHNDVVRFEKFRHITECILDRRYTKQIEKDLGGRFSRLVFERIVECSYVRGAKQFLEYFCKKMPVYIVTASPGEEFDRILKARNMGRYFKDVYSVPWAKKDALIDILAKENISPEEAVFIGDSFEDYRAAKASRVHFIGRDSGKSFKRADIPVYDDLKEIGSFLRSKCCIGKA
jgi:phosphoglycolate phosphatase-like HAD superfamily hydrolase